MISQNVSFPICVLLQIIYVAKGKFKFAEIQLISNLRYGNWHNNNSLNNN